MTPTRHIMRTTAERRTHAWRSPRRIAFDLAAAVGLTCLSALASVAAEPGAAAEVVAAQIRSQGYACLSPVSAVRDQAASRPNAAVWILRCGNALYRVRLDPDMAAQVTQLK